jgi:hypothetical protein
MLVLGDPRPYRARALGHRYHVSEGGRIGASVGQNAGYLEKSTRTYECQGERQIQLYRLHRPRSGIARERGV